LLIYLFRSEKSFNSKEKKKRDRGQASRAKNYVEEEKRMLRSYEGNLAFSK
jgi:hypothetical protein